LDAVVTVLVELVELKHGPNDVMLLFFFGNRDAAGWDRQGNSTEGGFVPELCLRKYN
jgi:hypothetical protein